MKMLMTNLSDVYPFSTDINNAFGTQIRILVPPLETVEVLNVDPCFINQSKVLRNSVFRDGTLSVQFVREADDLVACGQGAESSALITARVGTTGNIVLSGPQTIDGIALAVGDRVLVKNQTVASENGIYLVRSGAWVRAGDLPVGLTDPNVFLWVSEGGQADTAWVLTNDAPITVGTTGLVWQKFADISAVTGATGLVAFGADSVGSSPTTRYLYPNYAERIAEVTPVFWTSPRSGTLRNLYVRHGIPAGNGNNIVYRIRVNTVATALLLSLASTGSVASNTTNTVILAAGDRVDLQVVKTINVGASPRNVVATMEVA